MKAYAVVETGGKQYRVSPNCWLDVELLEGEVGDKIKLDQVLALSDGESLKVGAPVLQGATVDAEIIDRHRADKVVAFKKKRRKGYTRKVGHRQNLVRLKVTAINA
jgi:large subunit ribosomal protein L21